MLRIAFAGRECEAGEFEWFGWSGDQRLLARYLFAHTTAHRAWAGTEVDNIAEQEPWRKRGLPGKGSPARRGGAMAPGETE